MTPRVVLPQSLLDELRKSTGPFRWTARHWAGEGVISLLASDEFTSGNPCEISVLFGPLDTLTDESPVDAMPSIVLSCRSDSAPAGLLPASHMECRVRLQENQGWKDAALTVIDDRDIFHRISGLLETDALREEQVAIFGVGSLGAEVALGLAKAGVGAFTLVDHDVLEPGNTCRHPSPLSHVGRHKTHSVEELIRGKNPRVQVKTRESRLTWASSGEAREIVQKSTLVIAGLDNHEGRVILNRVCLDSAVACIFAGLRRRAYGGQVLILRPGSGPCYSCHVHSNPEMTQSEPSDTAPAYSDRPAPIEPGLATDIAPVATMATKLAIQHLLRDKESTLRSLDEDLAAPLYIWFNRREANTSIAGIPPLGYGVAELAILRWYGLPLPRDPHCPSCGSYEPTK
ncbi:MAG: hypothetical protein AMXMBFR84_47430 [Candidatus Hydrogenedentota bacterium]